ncbi:UNVERIFIED_ORG: hypothetical protein J2Y77_000441 [Pseudomonas lini]
MHARIVRGGSATLLSWSEAVLHDRAAFATLSLQLSIFSQRAGEMPNAWVCNRVMWL